ncbi:hypothetical protein LPJ66_004149 [Kickxella alabastrina]|uniref:Uncharacterized protein n=1 Tax=Kickxella alabastrina TaxID=61397 RepID=A0ACC1IN55_9FUNG|nr:hypothetical protein LPJ66_004149 [Kickxella alabastrina]
MNFWNLQTYSVNGKVVVITGALGAIGKALALRLAELGACVALVDIAPDKDGQLFCAEINKRFGQTVAAYLAADLRRKDDIAHMLEWAYTHFGHLDVLINNAGVASPAMLYEGETFDQISAILDINLRAPIEATRLFVKYLTEKQRQGVVVNMASMGGLVPNRGGEVYGAAKAALIHLTRASQSLAPQIRVSAVAPYYVKTPMVLNNPKLQNNSTVFPQLMLDVEQVCAATTRCIEDTTSAGKTFAMIGRSKHVRMWHFDLAVVHITILAGWSLMVACVCRLLRIK